MTTEIWHYLVQHPEFALIGSVTLIQIAPIHINPWSAVLRLIRGVLVGDMEESLTEMKQDLLGLREDVEQEKVTNMRWNILDFANSCRNNRRHTKDEWRHVIDQLVEYEPTQKSTTSTTALSRRRPYTCAASIKSGVIRMTFYDT